MSSVENDNPTNINLMAVENLKLIGHERLTEFLSRFQKDLVLFTIPSPTWSDQDYANLSAALASPALPTAIADALWAIEELAQPQQQQELDKRVYHSPLILNIDPKSPAILQAFQLWLWKSYEPLTPRKQLIVLYPDAPVPATPNSSQLHPTPVKELEKGEVGRGEPDSINQSSCELLVDSQEILPAPATPNSTQLQSTPVKTPAESSESRVFFPDPGQSSNSAPETNPPAGNYRRRNGKVAHLPKNVRDQINVMLQDGLEYAEIIKNLGADGEGLLEKNIGSWKAGGFQDWLHDQERLQTIQRKFEFAMDLIANIKEEDLGKIQQSTLYVAAVNLIDLLVDFDPGVLRAALESDSNRYCKLLYSISRLSDAAGKCERHRTDNAERQLKIAKEKARAERKGGVSDEAMKLAIEKLNLM